MVVFDFSLVTLGPGGSTVISANAAEQNPQEPQEEEEPHGRRASTELLLCNVANENASMCSLCCSYQALNQGVSRQTTP